MDVANCRRLRVMHFDNARTRGGAEEHLLTLMRGLDRTVFEPTVAGHPTLMRLLRPDLPADVEAIPVELTGLSDVRAGLEFFRLLRARRIDIVHSHMFQASRLASPLAWMAGVPLIIETPHVAERWRRGTLKRSYAPDRIVGRFVTNFIAVSESNGRYLMNEKRLPADKITVIRNGVELERFDPQRSAPPLMRSVLGLEERAPVVVVLARLEPQKGHRILLDAWRSVVEVAPAARLVCVGDGELRGELEARALALGLGSSVDFVGFKRNTEDWLALASFTVLPSLYEGLPLAALESMAAGRAVVATSVDGSPEVVIHEKTGLLVAPGEPIPLGRAIRRLLFSTNFAKALGSAGRKLVEERFSDRSQVSSTEDLYLAGMRRRPTPRCVQRSRGGVAQCACLSLARPALPAQPAGTR